MSADPWHGPVSLARGIAQARAALEASAARFDLAAWLVEIDRQERIMRAATPAYERFDRAARRLTPAVVGASCDAQAIASLEARLRRARYPTGFGRLDRVWSRAELGELIVAATNRGRQLAAGDRRRAKGPRLDPRRIPDARLELLIQRHADMAVVEALRAERNRRAEARRLTP